MSMPIYNNQPFTAILYQLIQDVTQLAQSISSRPAGSPPPAVYNNGPKTDSFQSSNGPYNLFPSADKPQSKAVAPPPYGANPPTYSRYAATPTSTPVTPQDKGQPPYNAPATTPGSPGGKVSNAAVNGGGPKELVLNNTDSKPMTIALFENSGPGMNPNIKNPNNQYTLQPGETVKLSMPESWQGRAQKLGGKADDPATWAEINFENKGGQNKIWFDESTIRGYNSAVTMAPTHGGASAGSSQSILNGAPADTTTTDAGGNKVINATEPYTGGVNQNVVDYMNQAVGNTNAYVRFNDNNAVRTTEDNSLTVNFSAA